MLARQADQHDEELSEDKVDENDQEGGSLYHRSHSTYRALIVAELLANGVGLLFKLGGFLRLTNLHNVSIICSLANGVLVLAEALQGALTRRDLINVIGQNIDFLPLFGLLVGSLL